MSKRINSTINYLAELRGVKRNILWASLIFGVILFFGINNPLASLIEIFVLLIFIIITGIYFYTINKFAGYLLIPYFLWVSFASFLNYSIWKLNA